MMSKVRPSRKDLESANSMRFSLESKEKSKQQRKSNTAKERVLSSHEYQSLKSQGKVKACVGPLNSDVPRDLRREPEGKILVEPKSLGNQQWQGVKGKATKGDELVKHMSNLPGYLQRMEAGENLQDKAFNVGVLDWALLEKWKSSQKFIQAGGYNNVSYRSTGLPLKTTIKSSIFSTVAQGGAHAHQSEQHRSLSPGFNPSQKDSRLRGGKPSVQKVLRYQDLEISPKSKLGGHRNITRAGKSFVGNHADASVKKVKTKDSDQKITSEMENLSINLSNYEKTGPNLMGKRSCWDDEFKKRVEETKELNTNRKALDQKIISEMGTSSATLRTYGDSPCSKEKLIVGSDKTNKRTQKINLDDSRMQLDENLIEANQKILSGGSSLEDVCSEEICSDIPHSCPLRSKVETKIKPNLTALSLANSPRGGLASDALKTPYSKKTSNILSDGKEAEPDTLEHMNANVIENLKILNQETAATKSRNPSPNRRFSFSLSRIGRSLSWKEGSTVPQLSSTYVSVKSGPIKSEEVSCLDDLNRGRVNGPNRARSSPLRRILDPLLRSKSSNPVGSHETVQPKRSVGDISLRPVNACESLPNEKQEPSTTQAVLQLTIKNGLPLFSFLVDNNCNVLAAPTKNLTCGKDDYSQIYTFYSVKEIKRKLGTWITQGNKERSCGHVYNVIGQMKVSGSSYVDLTGEKPKNQYIVRESVLFGVELRHADQASPMFVPSKELAAAVVKMPIESLGYLALQNDEDVIEKGLAECLSRNHCSFNSEKDDKTYSTTVILPGGVHGSPIKGAPSPLIERWKSGGLCDCGGWDLGCKLRILTNHDGNCKISRTSNCCTNSACFELFLQGGTQLNSPILSLAPLNKEIYSVEFNSSLSLLQAFFVCMTVLSRQRSTDISEMNSPCEVKSFQAERMVNENGIRNVRPKILSEKLPAKYAPNPPASPVGRV